MDKKEEIMQSATHLFWEKGYFSTSVQEVANGCGISKGTLYSFFNSKEELLIQVIKYNHNKMLQQTVNVNLDSSLSPKERLIQKIVVQFDSFRKNKDFMGMLLRALPPHDNPQIPLLMKRIRVAMANWYKECLIEAYGDKVEPYIWDLVFMFQGALKEYAALAVHENKDINSQNAARFIVEQFDTMIHHTTDLEPVLTPEEMAEYEVFETDLEPESPEEQIDQLMEELHGRIKNLSIHEETRQDSILAIQSLQKEIHAHEPRRFLIKSLLLYLAEIEECKPLVRRVEKVFQTLQTK